LPLISGCPEKKSEQAPETKATEQVQKPKPTTNESLGGAWEPDVRANLLKMIKTYGKESEQYDAQSPPVVVFDFDHTCIRGDIGRAFYDWMILNRKIQFNDAVWEALPGDKRESLKAAWKAVTALPESKQSESSELQKFRKLMHQAYWSLCYQTAPEKCYPWQVRFYAGYTPGELKELAYQVMQQEMERPLGSEQIRANPDDQTPAITSTGIRIFNEIRELMMVLRRKGFKVWVVSAGPQWVVQGATKYFAVNPGQVIGMRTKLVDGKLTSEIESPPTFKQGKVDAIKKFIGVKPVLALGDSWTDAEMLEYAEHAVLIDRGYADLKKKATESGWWIQPVFPVD